MWSLGSILLVSVSGGVTVIHLCNTDTWLYLFGDCIIRFDCNTDTSVKQTLGSVPLVSVLKRFDSNTDTSVKWTLGSVPLVSVLKRFDCKKTFKFATILRLHSAQSSLESLSKTKEHVIKIQVNKCGSLEIFFQFTN